MTLHIYLVACHYYGHVTAMRILILMNCYGITNLLLRKFTFTENQTFLRNFYTSKIWSHTVSVLYLTIWLQIFVVENFCNYTVITKILFMKFLSQLIILDAINAG